MTFLKHIRIMESFTAYCTAYNPNILLLQVQRAKASIQDEQDLAERLRKEMREFQGDSQRQVNHKIYVGFNFHTI